jgi:hypothetical protein
MIQVTEDGGGAWRKIEVTALPGVPVTAFVNDIKTDLYDANTVYAVLDNHKFGDLNPYLYKSINKGKSWTSIKGNLPERTLLWRIVQDHENKDLFFLATEFGIYFTIDAGKIWTKLAGNIPTISFRDLAIQKRENDLVGASFGRGFFVLDDYSPLRSVTEEQLKKEATLFQPKDAWWYIERPVVSFEERGAQGVANFQAPNPPFGAVFTYYLSEGIKTKKQDREEAEKELSKSNADIPFPGWDSLEIERRQDAPKMLLIVKDSNGQVVQTVEGPVTKGFNRVAWDLTYPATYAIATDRLISKNQPKGMLAAPGNYSVTLAKQVDGQIITLSESFSFDVVQLHKGALEGASTKDVAAFWREIEKMQRATSATTMALKSTMKKVDAMRLALSRTQIDPAELDHKLYRIKDELLSLDEKINGNTSKEEVGEKSPPSIAQRLYVAMSGTANSTYGPTPMLMRSMEIAKEEYSEVKLEIDDIRRVQIPALEILLINAGAPWIEGQPLPEGF